MLKLVSVFEIETGEFSNTVGEDVTQKLLTEGFDVINDDGGCDVIVLPRFGTNASIELLGHREDVQTRCYVILCGDLYGISRKEAEAQMRDNLDILEKHYKVLAYVWKIEEE